MTPHQFIAKWQAADLSERSAYQQHFLDLCELLDHPKPADVDPTVKALAKAHKRLDEAVFAACGWPADLSDDELLAKLLALNLARVAKR